MADRSQAPKPSPTDVLFAGWLAQGEERADFTAFCRDHPEHALALQRLHEEWQRVGALLEMAGFKTVVDLERSFAQRLKEKYGSGVDPAISLEGGEKERADPASSELLERLAEHGPKRSRYQLEGKIAEGGMGAILKV